MAQLAMTAAVAPEVVEGRATPQLFVGLDVSDQFTTLCVLDVAGEIVEEGRLRTTASAFTQRFTTMPAARLVLETGPQSPWISRTLAALAQHEVLVANARRLRLIAENNAKSDAVDAELLARLGRLDPTLLAPVQHRRATTQADLGVLRARDAVVRTRTLLINHVRGAVKAVGGQLPRCSAPSFARHAAPALPAEVRAGLTPLLDTIAALSRTIAGYDRAIVRRAANAYPETARLMQPRGVGALTALCYVLTLEDPHRFPRSRAVGSYLGLRPRRDQSGGHDAQLRITKAGDALLRRLLVSSAQYMLGPFGEDSDLRRWGLALASRGGKNAKKRAVVAVARKLAVLLHHLWVTGEPYVPLRPASLATATTVGPA